MKFADVFRGSKIGERIVAESRATAYAERTALVQERERERAACEVDCERLARDADAAAALAAEAEAAWKRAQTAAQEARGALIARSAQGEALVGRSNRELELGADADGRIQAFIDELVHLFDERRHNFGDSPAMGRHLAGLLAAQKECRELKIAAVPDVGAALTEIRSRVPSRFATAA